MMHRHVKAVLRKMKQIVHIYGTMKRGILARKKTRIDEYEDKINKKKINRASESAGRNRLDISGRKNLDRRFAQAKPRI